MQDCTDIGPHYAVTLREWRAAWERERMAVLRLGYSQAFWRKYRCAAGRAAIRVRSPCSADETWLASMPGSHTAEPSWRQLSISNSIHAALLMLFWRKQGIAGRCSADAQRGASYCRFYFAYCEAAFDAKYLHNFQSLWEKSSEPGAAATARAPMGPSELRKQALPSLHSAPSDPTTQVASWQCAPPLF